MRIAPRYLRKTKFRGGKKKAEMLKCSKDLGIKYAFKRKELATPHKNAFKRDTLTSLFPSADLS